MDSARSLRRCLLKLYKGPELFDPNIIQFRPRSVKKVGDYCKVAKPKHQYFGKIVQVIAMYGGIVLVQLGPKQFHLKEAELEWMRKG